MLVFIMFSKLFVIKFVHSLIFWWQVACLTFLLYAGIARVFDVFVAVALASISFNGLLLLLNAGRCPMTTLAERQGAAQGSVTGIFLPDAIPLNVFKVSVPLFCIELLLLVVRYISGW